MTSKCSRKSLYGYDVLCCSLNHPSNIINYKKILICVNRLWKALRRANLNDKDLPQNSKNNPPFYIVVQIPSDVR
jgi:hypothetical protein